MKRTAKLLDRLEKTYPAGGSAAAGASAPTDHAVPASRSAETKVR
jgi:hypothetical protein